jgi:hypothetical protein
VTVSEQDFLSVFYVMFSPGWLLLLVFVEMLGRATWQFKKKTKCSK